MQNSSRSKMRRGVRRGIEGFQVNVIKFCIENDIVAMDCLIFHSRNSTSNLPRRMPSLGNGEVPTGPWNRISEGRMELNYFAPPKDERDGLT